MNPSRDPIHETLVEEFIQFQPADLVRHGGSVARLAADLAEAAGCPPLERSQIQTGGLLHDIGKQFIPSSILEKQGRLTRAEFLRIQQHPWVGYVYLTSFVSDADVLNTVLYHHERWNGSGYPYGLAGDHIPLGARICALADVWDALVSDRCYRSAWGLTQALELIWAGAGSLFDPQLTEQFIDIVEAHYLGSRDPASTERPASSRIPWNPAAWEPLPLDPRRAPRASRPATE